MIQIKAQKAWEINKKFSKDLPQHINSYPFETLLVERNLDEWLRINETEINKHNFHPHKVEFFKEPKKNGSNRNSCILGLDNALYYTTVILKIFPEIYKKWQETNIVAHKKEVYSAGIYPAWVLNDIANAKLHMGHMPEIGKEYKIVCKTDISDFSSNINLKMLMHDLENIGVEAPLFEKLYECLYLWSDLSDSGLPLTYWGTDILGEVYLMDIDKELQDNNILYSRKSDDIWIYCKADNEISGKLEILEKILSKKNLQLNKSKNKTIQVSEIKTRQSTFRRIFSVYNTYFFFKEFIRKDLENDLLQNPEKTSALLNSISSPQKAEDIISYLILKKELTDYQLYFLIKWLAQNFQSKNPKLENYILALAKTDKPYFLKSICRKFLFNYCDISLLFHEISNSLSEDCNLSQATELICLLKDSKTELPNLPFDNNLLIKFAKKYANY